uniref:DnaJ subfamily B member 5 n=1 Tax=Arundo donax TaxID=35708 RepID=A0A0A9DT51_ARUDO
MMELIGTVRLRPSSVVRWTAYPVRASARGTFCVSTRSLPSRVNTGCGFSSMIKTRSAGMLFGAALPLSGKVILVPFFHPGFTSIVRISSNEVVLLEVEIISLETLIFLVVPLYSSSRLHGSLRSIACAFTARRPLPCLSAAGTKGELNISCCPPKGELNVSFCSWKPEPKIEEDGKSAPMPASLRMPLIAATPHDELMTFRTGCRGFLFSRRLRS